MVEYIIIKYIIDFNKTVKRNDSANQMHVETRNVFKKDKRRRIKKGKKYLYINLTQMTENLE